VDREPIYVMGVSENVAGQGLRRVAGMTGRILLSGVVVWVLIVCLTVFLRSPLSSSGDRSVRTPDAVREAPPQQALRPVLTGLWPHFPTSYEGSSRAMVVNGVKFISETSRTWAPSSAVLDYYQCQMMARGWRDVTEESNNMRPETRQERAGDAGLQDPQYLEVYRQVTETTRVFSDGVWTMHVHAEASSEHKGQTQVMINAAEVPSLKDFAGVWASLGRSDSSGNNELDVVEHRDGQRYHTRITVQSRPSATVFAEALERVRADHWRPTLVSVAAPGGRDHVAMLVKGGQYASLTATDTKDGKKASVTWTEVTPESSGNISR
jgi:hypothetical protein